MIDFTRFNEVLDLYMKDFSGKTWPSERYKWQAVKHFQENWDIGAEDFAAMLESSLAKASNLLTSANNFPKGTIVEFAKMAPGEVRAMFAALFDDSRDYWGRIDEFKQKSNELAKRHEGDQGYQNESSITTYLWLRYPDRYYIYKYGEARSAAEELGGGYAIRQGHYAENIRSHLALYDEISAELRKRSDLRELLDANLSDDCYPDPQMRTLAIDFGFYIAHYLQDSEAHLRAGRQGAPGHWWLSASPKRWSFSDIAIGDVQNYTLYNEKGNKRRIFQNFLDAKVGDMVIGYESNPVKQVVAIARIAAEQDGERLYFEKVEDLAAPIGYKALSDSPELEGMEYFVNPQGSLFKLTPGEYRFIMSLIREQNPLPAAAGTEPYGKQSFLEDVFMGEGSYDRLCAILKRKKNVILQGAPGVGKTFAARRLAWSIMGEKDDGRIELVQFHQNYSYEDFIMGYRPEGDSFELKHGVFYRFCRKAADQPDKPFFFIIDEINRGNLSKIFGELLMLIEADYRGYEATLAYNGQRFSVPENLHIIGMMNTADRSLAMIDYALRRRFSFFDMEPGFGTEGFRRYREGLGSDVVDALVEKVEELNAEIAGDKSLGKGFCIGHSYFCGIGAEEDADEWCRQVVDFDILPMLREYWFDDEDKVAHWEGSLRGVLR